MNPVDHPHGGGNHQVRQSYCHVFLSDLVSTSTLEKRRQLPVLLFPVKKLVLLLLVGYVMSRLIIFNGHSCSRAPSVDGSLAWYRQGQRRIDLNVSPLEILYACLTFIFLYLNTKSRCMHIV